MIRVLVTVLAVLAMAACSTPNAPVATTGFKFADYDFIVVAKPEEPALYGMDVALANLLDARGFTTVGDKAYARLTPMEQRRTLNARLALTRDGSKNLLAVSFDDAITGKTGVSISEVAKGDIFDNDDRRAAFEKLAKAIELAFQPETFELNAKLAAKNQAASASVQPAERIEPPQKLYAVPIRR